MGRDLGGFQVQSLIGAGSMGTVYRAWQPSLRRQVALKVIPAGEDSASDETQRFRREGRLQSRLSHPHLVKIHDQGEDGPWIWIAMELVEGESLRARIRTVGPVPEAEATRHALQIADALQYLHEEGVVHRDIKSDNVLLDRTGHVRLTDFGLSRCSEDTLITLQKSMIGTVRYMAPEVFSQGKVDSASDMYSLGVILYYMVSARFPHEGEGRELLASILHEPPVPLAKVTQVTPHYQGLVADLLAKEGSARPGAREVRDRLQDSPIGSLQRPTGLTAPPPRTPPARSVQRPAISVERPALEPIPRRRSWIAGGAVLAGLVAIALLGNPTGPAPIPAPSGPTGAASAAPASPAPEWSIRRDKLLARFRERLGSMAPRLWILRPGEAEFGFQEQFWDKLERRMTPRHPPGISSWFLVMEPGSIEETHVTASWSEDRIPVVGEFRVMERPDGSTEEVFESARFELNGETVAHRVEPDGKLRIELSPARLRPGLNRLWIGPLSVAKARKFRANIFERRRGPLEAPRQTLGLCLEPSLLDREALWQGEVFGGRWVGAEKRARELDAAHPGDPCAMWQLSLSHCLLARAIRDVQLSTRGIGAMADNVASRIFPIQVPDPERLAIDMGTSMDQLHRLLHDAGRSARGWRTLGETLCVTADKEMGWAAMMYACLLAPDMPDIWFAFCLAYEGDRAVEPRLEARRSEVRECLLVARDLPLGEHRLFESMNRHLAGSLAQLEAK